MPILLTEFLILPKGITLRKGASTTLTMFPDGRAVSGFLQFDMAGGRMHRQEHISFHEFFSWDLLTTLVTRQKCWSAYRKQLVAVPATDPSDAFMDIAMKAILEHWTFKVVQAKNSFVLQIMQDRKVLNGGKILRSKLKPFIEVNE